MKVKSILVSQPEPKAENSPYAQIIQNHNVKVDFVPFIKVEGMTAKELRTSECRRLTLPNLQPLFLPAANL